MCIDVRVKQWPNFHFLAKFTNVQVVEICLEFKQACPIKHRKEDSRPPLY
jgi:hypothetical protein